jgi:hypothetical protein
MTSGLLSGIKLALGVRLLLIDAIAKHRRAYWRMPKRFELHPSHFADLRREMRHDEAFYMHKDAKFLGVQVIVHDDVERPKMVTSDKRHRVPLNSHRGNLGTVGAYSSRA